MSVVGVWCLVSAGQLLSLHLKARNRTTVDFKQFDVFLVFCKEFTHLCLCPCLVSVSGFTLAILPANTHTAGILNQITKSSVSVSAFVSGVWCLPGSYYRCI